MGVMRRTSSVGVASVRPAPGSIRGPRRRLLAAGATLLLSAAFAGVLPTPTARAEPGERPDPAVAVPGAADPAVRAGAPDGPRFALTDEQRERLRAAREAEARKLLGLAADAPLPSEAELSDAQKKTIREARDAELRRVLGLGPSDPLPNRATVTAEQRARIAAAHEARLREALGLGPEDSLPLASPPPASPTPTPTAAKGDAQ